MNELDMNSSHVILSFIYLWRVNVLLEFMAFLELLELFYETNLIMEAFEVFI